MSLARRGYLALIVVVVSLSACGDDAATTTTSMSTTPTRATTTTASTTTASTLPAVTKVAPPGPLLLWFPIATDDRITPERRVVAGGPSDILQALADGPRSQDLNRAFAPSTVVTHTVSGDAVSVQMDPPPGAIGRAAVAASLRETGQFNAVRVNGELVEPDESLVAKVTVVEPGPGDSVTSLVEVKGTAIAFEGTVNARLTDASGVVLWSGFTNTDAADAGQRGDFALTLEFLVPSATPAELQVFSEFSAVGEDSFSRTLPLVLVPG